MALQAALTSSAPTAAPLRFLSQRRRLVRWPRLREPRFWPWPRLPSARLPSGAGGRSARLRQRRLPRSSAEEGRALWEGMDAGGGQSDGGEWLLLE